MKIISFNKSATSYVDAFNMAADVFYLSSKNPVKRYFEIRNIIRAEKADLVWTWGGFEATFGLLLSLFNSVKHVNGSIRHGIVRFNRKQLWRLLILHLSRYRVANSQAGLKANRLRSGFVLYNGIDDSFFEPLSDCTHAVLDELKIGKSTPVLISVANLVPYKDYETIIKALSRLDGEGIDFHYLVIGEGPQRSYIQSLITNYSLTGKITLLGRRHDIRQCLRASHLFIHSSRGEGCSNAILEAMACGLPVIATDTGGTGEVLSDDVGFLFPFRDSNRLYRLVKDMLEHPDQRSLLGKAAARNARSRFSTEKMISEYHHIIQSIG